MELQLSLAHGRDEEKIRFLLVLLPLPMQLLLRMMSGR